MQLVHQTHLVDLAVLTTDKRQQFKPQACRYTPAEYYHHAVLVLLRLLQVINGCLW